MLLGISHMRDDFTNEYISLRKCWRLFKGRNESLVCDFSWVDVNKAGFPEIGYQKAREAIPSRSNLESQWISWSYLQERGWQLHPWVVPPYRGWWLKKDASVSPSPQVSFPPYILQQRPSPMQPKTMCTWWPEQSTFRMEEGFGASLSLLWRHVNSPTEVTVT